MSEGIAYQNKDIEFKLLSSTFKEKSFEAYGLKLPRIKEVLPTNLPSVSANEKRMDNLFLLEDNTLAIVDYESENKVSNSIKYLNYISRLMEQYYKEKQEVPNIRMIVIYTGDIETAEDIFQTECITLHMEQVFVCNLPAEEIYQTVTHKLEKKEKLTEQELTQLIILPLAEKGMENKQKRILQVIELAKQIEDEQEQTFVLTGLLVSSDKFINREYAEFIRRSIVMTKVFQIIEEEGIEKGREEGLEKGKMVEKRQTVENLLNMGMDVKFIMQATGLTGEEISKIQKGIAL